MSVSPQTQPGAVYAWFRAALAAKDIELCIPPRTNGKQDIPYDKEPCKQRYKVESMFGKL